MQVSRIEGSLPKALIEDASGAVVDRTDRYIGLIISTEEHPFHTPDLLSFDDTIDMLAKSGVPIQEERCLRRAFWLAAGVGGFFILIAWLAN